jgi:hypothetical protein
VRSRRPDDPRVLPRPDAKGPEGAAKSKAAKPRTEFIEWPVHVAVQGEYAQIDALLARLRKARWHVRINRLVLQPSGEDREMLTCDFEIVGYGLRARADTAREGKG